MNVTKFQKENISFWKLSISKAQGKPKTSKEKAKHTEFPKPQLETEKNSAYIHNTFDDLGNFTRK